MRLTPVFAGALFFFVNGLLTAQAMERTPKPKAKVSVNHEAQNEARNESGFIDENADIEGVTVINGDVSIDGVKVARGVKKFRSPKSGKTYRIDWGRNDNVSVSEQ